MDRPIEYPPAKGMLSEESKALMYAFTPEVRALNADYPYSADDPQQLSDDPLT